MSQLLIDDVRQFYRAALALERRVSILGDTTTR